MEFGEKLLAAYPMFFIFMGILHRRCSSVSICFAFSFTYTANKNDSDVSYFLGIIFFG